MTLRVSAQDAAQAADEPPGIFAEGKIKKLKREYERLHSENMKHGQLTSLTTPQEKDPELDDNTKPSITHFLHKFGLHNVADVIGMLQTISADQEETYVRIAHFFFHLGRRHERSIFK